MKKMTIKEQVIAEKQIILDTREGQMIAFVLVAMIMLYGLIIFGSSEIEHYKNQYENLKDDEVIICGNTNTQVITSDTRYIFDAGKKVIYLPELNRQILLSECFITSKLKQQAK